METLLARLRRMLGTDTVSGRPIQAARTLTCIALVGAGSWLGFLLHFNLSTASSLQFLLVVLVAFRWGFFQATVVSALGAVLLNFLFIAPIFTFTVADPANWISLAAFEATALLVSGLSSKVRLHAADSELQRARSTKLYELSRAVLLIDAKYSTTQQLATLIRELIDVQEVTFWALYDQPHADPDEVPQFDEDSAAAAYSSGINAHDPVAGLTKRMLRLGTTSIGAMTLRGWEFDSLLADAVASLAAIAIERARSVERENRAESERNTETLRTAVLDGLAHGFKTPLTAIQTASSGLLAIDGMTATQTELVSIIDEQATLLNQMTTRLLKTAALESADVRLRRRSIRLATLVEEVVAAQPKATRSRIEVVPSPDTVPDEVDPQMIQLALEQLIDNAAKYSTVETAIQISILHSDEETTVVVQNEGSPIKPAERERIFDRFYRAAAAAGPPGTGLGLSIVKKAAEAHGGRVWVESDHGFTRFLFALHHSGREKYAR